MKKFKFRWDWKTFLSAILLVLVVIVAIVLLRAYFRGEFDSVESLRAYIARCGLFAPVVLTVIQAMQVVVPVLPGFLGCAVGAMMFGTAVGFVCNYIGISLGSLIAFFLARRYGVVIVRALFKDKYYSKWEHWIGKWKCYPAVMFTATLLPLFPDDFFCYFSGLTNMRARQFLWIIILGKPWCILAYSFIFGGLL